MRSFYDHDTNEVAIFLGPHDYAHVDTLLSLGLFMAHDDHLTEWHNEEWAPAVQKSLDKIPEDRKMDPVKEAAQDREMAMIGALFGFEMVDPTPESEGEEWHPEPPC